MRFILSLQNWLFAANILLWISLQPGIASSSLVENTAYEWIEEVAATHTETRSQEKKSARPLLAFRSVSSCFHIDVTSIPHHFQLAHQAPWHRLNEKWLI